ncbi:hypothetical protein [[Clostridium] fimetarium]|uniref:Uncharacterized protein n=1 Tax=[Clostridium] fimetarium TaxID=99656 RepID=A0A1I0PZW6_9FIRM|nr:hypothetical protein [[Clostridium] fimetarium]SEW20135.1 hypothetical protein SAMN05421659_106175 [[Clostridium] fimetarium]
MEFNVYREQIRNRSELESFISLCWNSDKIKYRGGYGVITRSVESIVGGFEMTHRTFCKNISLLVHCFSITFDQGMSEAFVVNVAEQIKVYLSQNYQLIYLITENTDGRKETVFILNSVSYATGKNFCDNNKAYILLREKLKEITGIVCNIKFGQNVFFKAAGSNMNCYVR